MLKGCKRNIIMVKDTGSKYFDSAYFVLRNDLPPLSGENDMINEARRMIEGAGEGCLNAVSGKKSKHAYAILIPCIAILFVVGAAILALLI